MKVICRLNLYRKIAGMRRILFFLGFIVCLVFSSNGNVKAQEILMGDTLIVTCNADFFDDGGSLHGYSANQNSTLLFQSASGCILEANFSSFNLGAGDTLMVYDGCTVQSILLGSFTQSSPLIGSLFSTGNCLTFHFITDATDESSGWEAIVNCPTTPMAEINAVGPTSFCGGDSVMLIATGGVTYHWNTLSNEDTIVVSYPGTYEVTVTGASGCTDTARQEVIVYPLPPVGFILPYDSICILDPPFALSGGFPLGGIYSGDGVVAGVFDPTQTGEGVFTVRYSYTDSNGCSRTIPQSITVLICNGLSEQVSVDEFTFSPNPVHDELCINSKAAFANSEIRVLNLSGQVVIYNSVEFGSRELKLSVLNLPPGVYIIQIKDKAVVYKRIVKD